MTDGNHINCQIMKGCVVRFGLGANEQIDTTIQIREQLGPNELAKAPFHPVPVNDSPPVLGDDKAHPRMRQQGSRRQSFEPLGLNPLPCTSDNFEIGLARQP